MQQPSQQFVTKLEKELRMAYQGQYQPAPIAHPFLRFFKFFIPAFSGALVLIFILWNLKGNFVQTNQSPDQSNQQNIDNTSVTNFTAFDEGNNEEQVMQSFDNDELNQIDSGVKLVAESNY